MTAATGSRERCFELHLRPTGDSDGWGFRLVEAFDGCRETVAAVRAPCNAHLRRAALEAAHASGWPHAAVSPRRRQPLKLLQDPGVRLALTVNAAAPVTRPTRRSTIVDGVKSLSCEEALYWYARTGGPDGRRALHAFRLLLADD